MQNACDNKLGSTWLIPVRGVFLVLMCFLVMPVWATVAIIIDMTPNASFKVVDRYGHSKQLQFFDEVQEGDNITVKSGSITLMMDKQTATINAGESKTVKSSGPDKGIITAFAGWIRSLWKSEQEGTFLVTKGGKLRMPLLTKTLKRARNLVAGQRELHLGWIGGQSPYTVEVIQIYPYRVVLTKEVEETSVTLKSHLFSDNSSYQIVVTDASGAKVVGVFTVVTETKLPPYPTAIQKNSSKETKTGYAGFLAAQNKKWFLEAYQYVADITEFEEASLVEKALREGRRVR